jgi:hypothetical protein
MLNHSEDLGVCSSLITDFVTFDIETVIINNNITPYLICGYNGSEFIQSFGLNQKELFSSFLSQLLTFFKDNKKSLNQLNL